MNPQKKLKTYNITFKQHPGNPLSNKTVTYSANSPEEAQELFYADYPEQRQQPYIEIHSPLSNYAIDRDNEEIAENPNTNKMKKFNIQNIFKTVNEYVRHITLLLISVIPLLLLGVVLFGDNFFLGNVVVYNIQQMLDSMAGFVGIITLLIIVHVYYKFQSKT